MNNNFMNVLPVVLLISVFGLLALGAIAAFVISVVQQRRYDKSALPALEEPEEEVLISEDEELFESRFETSDEIFVLEDEETNELMKNIRKLDGSSEPQKKSGGLPSFNLRKPNTGKDGK